MSRTKLPLWTIFKPEQVSMLRTRAVEVPAATITTADFQYLIDDMVKTMHQANGIGLAAPQVGNSIRLAVISPDADPSLHQPLVLINPILTDHSPDQERGEEGCLSVPKVYGLVDRARRVTVKALDRTGQPFTLVGTGLLARVMQHEVDHLNGTLFIDRTDRITTGRDLLP
ncbi:MAG: peptide deformylase [Candidatus Kerfeldbacteria bacterium]|nr:peptide deformylase [Candidatus Kerfeldbacteria bacterium]